MNTAQTNNLLDDIGKLVKPSWLSSLVAIVSGLVASVGVIVAFHVSTSAFQLQLAALQQTNQSQPALTQPGETPPPGNTSLQSSLPLLALYAFIGLAIYYIAVSIVKSFQEVGELRREMSYVNAKPGQLRRAFIQKITTRMIALLLWLGFTQLFVRRLVPFAISASHASAPSIVSIDGVLYAVLAFVTIAVSMQIHTVFLRLAFQRARIFG